MNPVFAIFAVIWIIRAVTNKSGSDGTVRASKGTEVSPPILAVFLKLLVFGLALSIGAAVGRYGVIVVEAIAVPIFLPTLFLEWIAIPLGMHRFTFWWFRCTWPFGFGKETQVGAVFFGTRALARKGATQEKIDWLMRRLPQTSSSHIGYEISFGLLTALMGERDAAKLMFLAIDSPAAPSGWRKLRRTVRDWLVMDAVRHGDWRDAIRLGRRGRQSFRWSYVIARMAERLDRRPNALRNWQLWMLWLCAPRRIGLLPFVRQAVACPRLTGKVAVSVNRVSPKNLASALADLAAIIAQAQHNGLEPDRYEFLSTIRWVSVRLESPMTHIHIQQRLRLLGSSQAGIDNAIVNNFREQLTIMIMPIIERSPQLVQGEDERPVIKEAIQRIQQASFQDIEVHCRDYAIRAANQVSLFLKEEWGSWAKLRNIADHLLILAPAAEDALFREMYAPLCNFAVYQHNVVTRHRLAHDMFSWLYQHAKSNPAAAEMLAKNMRVYVRRD